MSRQLDAALAEALGYYMETVGPEVMVVKHNSDSYLSSHSVPCYSTDGNAMLELDREMRERGWVIDECFCTKVVKEYQWYVCYQSFSEGMRFDGQANAEPLARALSAYKALTGKEWVYCFI